MVQGHTYPGKPGQWSLCALFLAKYEKWKPPGLRTKGVRSTTRLQDRAGQGTHSALGSSGAGGASPASAGTGAVHRQISEPQLLPRTKRGRTTQDCGMDPLREGRESQPSWHTAGSPKPSCLICLRPGINPPTSLGSMTGRSSSILLQTSKLPIAPSSANKRNFRTRVGSSS